MHKRTDSLLFKFALLFVLIVVVALLLSGVSTYISQRAIYQKQCEERLVTIANHLKSLVMSEGAVFADFQRFFIAHKEDIHVPLDYDGHWIPSWQNFARLFQERHPGKIFGVDMAFTEMDTDVQMACAIALHRKWLALFEKAAKDFGIHYAYYLVPSPKPLHMYWVIDAVREEKVIDGKKYIELCTEVLEPLDAHQKMWQAWTTGGAANGYDTYDNQYGKTYAYYTAVSLDGVTIGIVGTEIDIETVNAAILKNTLIQMAGIGTILALSVACLLFIIYRKYIVKLERLQANVLQYTQDKNPAIVTAIENNATGKDEISALSMQTASMILELENYIKNLQDTTQALDREKERAEAMNALANKDALTGIRNKNAYDKEIKRLRWAVEDAKAQFGIAVIDLNYLKRINDTYGHEQGNITIKKLCHIVCTVFKHSPVFRIGGDEFAVILEHEDYAHATELVIQCNALLEATDCDDSLEPWEKVSAAIGIAFFDHTRDQTVENVFKRADKAMYARKKAMKALREA